MFARGRQPITRSLLMPGCRLQRSVPQHSPYGAQRRHAPVTCSQSETAESAGTQTTQRPQQFAEVAAASSPAQNRLPSVMTPKGAALALAAATIVGLGLKALFDRGSRCSLPFASCSRGIHIRLSVALPFAMHVWAF